MKCENCGKEHNGEYGSGRFCCNKCARAFSSKHVSEEGRRKQKETLKNPKNREKALNSWMEKCDYTLNDNGKWTREEPPKYNQVKAKKKHKHSLTLGKIGELKTAQKFLNHGYEVFVPLVDISGTDMIVEKNGDLKKIQVKSSSITTHDDNCTRLSLKSSDFNMRDGQVISYNKKYKKKNVDYFALYSDKDDDVYLIENNENRSSIHIRNKVSENNIYTVGKNLEKIHMAEEYQIDRVLDDIDKGINYKNIVEVTDFIDKSEN